MQNKDIVNLNLMYDSTVDRNQISMEKMYK